MLETLGFLFFGDLFGHVRRVDQKARERIYFMDHKGCCALVFVVQGLVVSGSTVLLHC